MKIVIILLLCLETANLQKSYHKKILDTKNKNFDAIGSKIYTTMNKLLSYLNIDEHSTNSVNVQRMLIISFHYNKMTEKTYEIYKDMKNISTTSIDTSNNINIEEILHDIVNDEIDKINNNIAKITNTIFETEIIHNKTEYNSAENTIENFDELWSKLGDRTIESLIDPILNETEITNDVESSFYTTNKSREIKAWKPPSSVDEFVIRNSNTRRIYKGKKAKIKSYPFLVSIHIMTEFMCAGSIISKDMVITAASCLQIAYKNNIYRDNPRSIFVRLASDYTKRSGELIPIVKVFFHPQYDPVTLRNNVAIIKMLENIKHIKNRKIKRIKYDRRAEALANDGTEVTILGWGAKDEKHIKPSNSQKLAVADLDIYDINDCKEVYSKYYVTDTNFCAGFTYKGGGACMGDVGGPAVISGELVGLISFGPTVCGLPDAPTVFTKVGFYAKWIDDIVNQKPRTTPEVIPTTIATTKSPQLFIVPLYTTPSSNNLPRKLVTKRKMRAKPTDYPEEVQYLKKIIQEYILTNSSIVDYLLNGDILEDDSVKVNVERNNLFLDREKYKAEKTQITTHIPTQRLTHKKVYKPTNPGKNTRPYKTPSTVKAVNYSSAKNRATQTLRYEKSTRPVTNYDDLEELIKKTTFRTPYDSSELSDNDSNETVYNTDENSSYYEQGIPIEVTDFQLSSKDDLHKMEDKIASVHKLPKIPDILRNGQINVNKTYTLHQNATSRQELKSVTYETTKKHFRSEEVTSDDTPTVMITWPLGATMSISNEDFEYMSKERYSLEDKKASSNTNLTTESEWNKRQE